MLNQSHRGMQPNMRCLQQQLSVCNRSCALGVVAVCASKFFDLDYVGTSSTNTHTCTHANIYMHTFKHTYIYTHINIHTYIFLSVGVCLPVCVCRSVNCL